MARDDDVLALLHTLLLRPGRPVPARVAESLRLLAKHRSETLARELLPHLGTAVRSGPFAGLAFGDAAVEGSTLPKILGTYESELHPVFAGAAGRGYAGVIDIGCAEGYYAVGLARLLPGARVFAFDTDPAARARCAAMAAENGVADRVDVLGRFSPVDHAPPPDTRILVVCDVEGAEVEVLGGPGPWAQADLVVEVHDMFTPGSGDRIREAFAATHRVTRIPSGACALPDVPELHDLDALDRLLALWDWRLAGNYWLRLDSASAT